MGELVLKASAKINLDLRITGRRADGFHELRTVFQSLALHDVLVFRRVRTDFRLDGVAPGVPLDQGNLIWRAAEAAWRVAGRRGSVRGVAVVVRKRIPPAAGLGGGSSDAAATLVAVNRILRLGLRPEQVHDTAAALGSDVPFFLLGGTALGLGRGEDLYPLPDVPPHHVVLVRPPFGVRTPDAYRWFAETLSPTPGHTPSQRQTRTAGQSLGVPWRAAGLGIVNDLESGVLPRHDEIRTAREALLGRGAAVALMAGSGSTVFGLFTDRRTAERAADAARLPGWTVILTRTLGRRAIASRLAGTAAIE